jgi:CRP-like cAMP-binding protein
MILYPLEEIPIFEDLTAYQIGLLNQIFSSVQCEEDEVIFEQDTEAECLFIIADGEVEIVFNPDDGEPIHVSQITKGGVFGWSAAFGSGRYTSGAICTQCSTLMKVKGEDLKILRQNHPETGILILERLAEVVSERFESSDTHSQVVAMLENALKNGLKLIGG